MRGRLEAKLEELRASAAEAARKELERKYAVRYHKVRLIALPFPLAVKPSAASRMPVLQAACRTAALHCHPCCWRVVDCTCQVQQLVVAQPHALRTAVALRSTHWCGLDVGHALASLQVRFFERVKLERRLHRLQAQLAAADKAASAGGDADGAAAGGATSAEQLRQQIAAVKEDLEYVLHFPKAEKFVSLLRQAETPEAQVGRS